MVEDDGLSVETIRKQQRNRLEVLQLEKGLVFVLAAGINRTVIDRLDQKRADEILRGDNVRFERDIYYRPPVRRTLITSAVI